MDFPAFQYYQTLLYDLPTLLLLTSNLMILSLALLEDPLDYCILFLCYYQMYSAFLGNISDTLYYKINHSLICDV